MCTAASMGTLSWPTSPNTIPMQTSRLPLQSSTSAALDNESTLCDSLILVLVPVWFLFLLLYADAVRWCCTLLLYTGDVHWCCTMVLYTADVQHCYCSSCCFLFLFFPKFFVLLPTSNPKLTVWFLFLSFFDSFVPVLTHNELHHASH